MGSGGGVPIWGSLLGSPPPPSSPPSPTDRTRSQSAEPFHRATVLEIGGWGGRLLGVPAPFIPPQTPPAPHRRPAPIPAPCSRRSLWGSGRSGSSEPRGGARGGRFLWGSPTAPSARNAAPHKCRTTGGAAPKGCGTRVPMGGGRKGGGQVGVLYGPIWTHMVLYGPLWSCMAPYGPVWPYMALYGPVWHGVALYGPVWPYMVLYGTIWSCMAPYGPVWPHMVLYGTVWPYMALYGPIWSCMALYGPV